MGRAVEHFKCNGQKRVYPVISGQSRVSHSMYLRSRENPVEHPLSAKDSQGVPRGATLPAPASSSGRKSGASSKDRAIMRAETPRIKSPSCFKCIVRMSPKPDALPYSKRPTECYVTYNCWNLTELSRYNVAKLHIKVTQVCGTSVFLCSMTVVQQQQHDGI